MDGCDEDTISLKLPSGKALKLSFYTDRRGSSVDLIAAQTLAHRDLEGSTSKVLSDQSFDIPPMCLHVPPPYPVVL